MSGNPSKPKAASIRRTAARSAVFGRNVNACAALNHSNDAVTAVGSNDRSMFAINGGSEAFVPRGNHISKGRSIFRLASSVPAISGDSNGSNQHSKLELQA